MRDTDTCKKKKWPATLYDGMKAPFPVMNLPEFLQKIPYMANKLETTTKVYISDNHIYVY